MPVVNPFAVDPERARAWEAGYLAGYAQPDDEHFPPLEGELLKVFGQGEATGRDDRRDEASTQDSVPSADAKGPRFESAPDGALIPIPEELPEGNVIRPDARVDVSLQGGGAFYYVVIFNFKKGVGKPDVLLADLVSEAALKRFEKFLAEAIFFNAKARVTYSAAAGLGISVVVSLFTASPILTERRFRAYDENLKPIQYVLLQPHI